MSAVEKYQPTTPARLTNDELRFIVNSELVPKQYRGKPTDIFACVLLGRQLGIGDMHSLRSIYVVDGKATISAELMVSLVRQRGHSITADYGEGRVTVNGRRADNEDEMSVTWTTSMAERAGLITKDNWKKYPEAMLWARAVSQLCRMLFADVFAGATYTGEEVELSAEERISEGVGELSVPDMGGPDDQMGAEGPGGGLTATGDSSVPDTGTGASSALVPAMHEDDQGSFFEQKREEAEERKRKKDAS